MLVDFGVWESTLGALSQCVVRGADFVHLRVSFGGCKNIVITYDNFAKKTAKLQYNIKKTCNLPSNNKIISPKNTNLLQISLII